MRLAKSFAISSCLFAAVFCGSTPAWAEEEEIEELSVIGSRSHERAAADLAVPVDILDSSELARQGDSRMDSMLSRIVPSLNVSQEPISDAATLVRPVQMRGGLSPDSTLVLMNGKRRHRSSIISFLVAGGSEGSHAPDLSAIPAVALDRVEVLRDGAAAQYGSDAVAGILNFVLREEAEGGRLEARWGQYYQGDGESITVSGNIGLPLTEKGFLNLSGEFSGVDPTSRSVQRADAQGLIDAGNPHVRTPAVQVWGAPEIDDNYKIFANAGIALGDMHEVYAFGGYAERTVEGGFFFRNPHRRGGVFVDGNDNPLVIDHAPLDGVDCPSLGKVDSGVDAEDLAAIEATPNCYAFNSRFPGGFTPQFGGEIEDESIAMGLRGDLGNALTYDISAVYGRHEVGFFMKNTINPQLASLENDIPTAYKPGSFVEEDVTVNLDFTQQIDVDVFHSPLNVGFGFEWREEEYEIKPGGMNSWLIDYVYNNGDEFDESTKSPLVISCKEYTEFLATINPMGGDENLQAKYPYLGIGSNGFPGFRPDPCVQNKNDRSSVAAYVDFEADVEEDLLMGLAVRYEDPEEFDSTIDGKFSARFQATDTLAVRSSLGSGFRVPTVGQASVRNVTTTLVGGRLTDELTVPPTDPLLRGIAKPLEAEESFSSGIGTVFNVGVLDVTIDFYHIEVKDRISLTSTRFLDCLLLEKNGVTGTCGKNTDDTTFDINLQDLSMAHQDLITNERDELRRDVPAIDSVAQVRYFANDFDTTTDGIDIVATYPMEVFGGSTQVTFAGNYNRTTVDEYNPNTISPRTKQQIEEGRPKIRWSLTADHEGGPWRVLGRVRYYGTHIDYHALALFQKADARFLTDLEVSYSLTDHFDVAVGAENLLDEEPSKNKYSTILGAEYPSSIPFDYNGGFYYLRAVASF
ncbi:MAG: TonB-dependent receptor [Gammaproteobacteria bacterium]|nr:TonB-dependent receptor [Gammaproteobacteria bacterium]